MDVSLDVATIRTHDLVMFAAHPYAGALPGWVDRVQGWAWAVVPRRPPSREGVIAAGLRGRVRAERQAIEVSRTDVVSVISPEELVATDAPIPVMSGPGDTAISATLKLITAEAPTRFGNRPWGPTGSVGFQIATGLPVVHAASDLDMVIRADRYLPPGEAASILHFLTRLPCRVDCLLETGTGAVALAEWAASRGGDVVQRTATGPHLTRDPWSSPAPSRNPAST